MQNVGTKVATGYVHVITGRTVIVTTSGSQYQSMLLTQM